MRLDKQSAVILVYHRVGDDAHPAANIRYDQFAEQMRLLKEENFNVLPLPDIIAALSAGRELPDKTVAITFDGAFRSVYDTALPVLKEYRFPYTLFISPAMASGHQDYISWAELKNLDSNKLVYLGLQSSAYAHLDGLSEDDLKRGVNNARSAFRENIGREPALFAYPFGEISKAYRDFIEAQQFDAAFGQQSGAASPASDIYALPRFVMTESYGDLERFETAISALPLPITGIEPADPFLSDINPAIGFTLPEPFTDRDDFDCFATGAQKPDMQRLGQGRVELRFAEPLNTDRVRINCTVAQSTDDPENPYRWRWFGLLYTIKGVTEITDNQTE